MRSTALYITHILHDNEVYVASWMDGQFFSDSVTLPRDASLWNERRRMVIQAFLSNRTRRDSAMAFYGVGVWGLQLRCVFFSSYKFCCATGDE